MSTGRVVWRYALELDEVVRIPVGANSRIVSIGMQHMPCVWVEHETKTTFKPVFDREWEIVLVVTGVAVPDGWSYGGLIQALTLVNGVPTFLVWHVYSRLSLVSVPDTIESIKFS